MAALHGRPLRRNRAEAAGAPVGVTLPVDDETCDYMCAAPVTRFGDAPPGCEKLTVEAAEYAVFAHNANISRLNETFRAVLDDWLPASGRALADAPSLETYNDTFDPRTGDGGVKLWMPLRPRG